MKATGIVRRIDDLGRVVIPKEMRKTLRIKEGDPLEIYTDLDQLVFKKYSPIISIDGYAKMVAEGLTQLIDKPCAVTDTDKIVHISLFKNKDYVDKELSSDYQKAIRDRKSLILNKTDGSKILPLVDGDDIQLENQIFVPIIANGDCYGSICVFDKEKENKFNSSDVKLVQMAAIFVSKQFEQ